MAASVRRLEAVAKLVEGLRNAYPDAKKIVIDVDFDWKEVDYMESELCPVVKINIER